MSGFLTLLKRDLVLAVREGGAVGTALGFYLIVVTLLPLGLGPDLKLLSRIASGILWIALLLAALLSLGQIFETDQEEGILDVMATGPLPLEGVVAAKALAHWISTGIPLVLLAPVLGILMNLPLDAYPTLMVTMLLGTPAVSFFGAIGAALVMKSRRGGLLTSLLVLPLYLPTLIFGISAMSSAALGPDGYVQSLMMLAALSLASMVIGPFAGAAVLKMQLQ